MLQCSETCFDADQDARSPRPALTSARSAQDGSATPIQPPDSAATIINTSPDGTDAARSRVATFPTNKRM
jgi:hypothetical protein